MMLLIALLICRVSRYGWKTTLKFIAVDIVIILILMGIGSCEINRQNEEWEIEQFQEEFYGY